MPDRVSIGSIDMALEWLEDYEGADDEIGLSCGDFITWALRNRAELLDIARAWGWLDVFGEEYASAKLRFRGSADSLLLKGKV